MHAKRFENSKVIICESLLNHMNIDIMEITICDYLQRDFHKRLVAFKMIICNEYFTQAVKDVFVTEYLIERRNGGGAIFEITLSNIGININDLLE